MFRCNVTQHLNVNLKRYFNLKFLISFLTLLINIIVFLGYSVLVALQVGSLAVDMTGRIFMGC